MIQKLFFLPFITHDPDMVDEYHLWFRGIPIPFAQPTRIWTLFGQTADHIPPDLPFVPVHHQNAFLEERIHDYDIDVRDEKYYLNWGSRVSEGGHWLLLEYDQAVPCCNIINETYARFCMTCGKTLVHHET